MFFKRYTLEECVSKMIDVSESIAYYEDLMLDSYEKQLDSEKVSKIIFKLHKELSSLRQYADSHFSESDIAEEYSVQCETQSQ